MKMQQTHRNGARRIGPPARALAVLVVALAAPASHVLASWLTIAEIPRLQVTVKMQPEGRVPKPKPQSLWSSWFENPPPPASAWFMFNYPRPVATSESFTFKSYKEHVVADCEHRAIGHDQFLAFGGPDGESNGVTSWTAPDAPLDMRPVVPGTIGAILFGYVCDGLPPFPTRDVLLQSGAAPAPMATPAEPASSTAVPTPEPSPKATQLK
ncbi:surface-adhesin E family protein [Pararobbsia alpina]|uniref:Surface-adhesin protein E-like domain-containing protein n=1 Tax=Pararobbsia alpina TaxID=621374 RepID=A0A6S7CAX6_9BURK|nr:surface-adhesin E family protein [Pararobbsia alpina]CAB3775848.1 hypothetical protein LMG28138_00029 [Pararobbsia alpina]